MLTPTLQQKIIREFGIEHETPEAQVYLLGKFAENVSNRIAYEVKKIIPQEKREEFDTLVAADDESVLKQFISTHVPNFEAFVQSEAQKEIDITKAYMLEESELAVTGGGQ